MMQAYVDLANTAVIQLMELSPRMWMVTSIGVRPDYRRKGHASRLLKRVLQEADIESIVLVLKIEPDSHNALQSGHPPMTYGELKQWYKRMGFQTWMDNDSMIRWPGNKIVDTPR